MRCSKCGLDEREHSYNGKAYGICGKFEPDDFSCEIEVFYRGEKMFKAYFNSKREALLTRMFLEQCPDWMDLTWGVTHQGQPLKLEVE